MDGALKEKGKDKIQLQIELSNALILWLQEYLKDSELSEQLIDVQGQLLTALYETQNPVAADFKKHVAQITPLTGFIQSELFTGSNMGLVTFVSSQGGKPMNITWKLKTPLSPFLWKDAAKLAVG